MIGANRGKLVYKIYRALSYSVSPLIYLHLQWRKFRGLEHSLRYRQRLGHPSVPRPPGQLMWFHAVSLGEGIAAIPVIKYCIQQRPGVTVLMTTSVTSAFEVIQSRLPPGVIHQVTPFDTPGPMDAFLGYWKPNVIILMESELWPNLIMGAAKYGITLALLNARMSERSFKRWSRPGLLPLIHLMLSKFSLIVPLSNTQAIHFQLLEAPPFLINFSGDLKYSVAESTVSDKDVKDLEVLQAQLVNRHVWLASSLHRGEEEVMVEVYELLMLTYPDMVAFIVPRYPHHGQEMATALQKHGLHVALRSRHERLMPSTNIYVVDTLGELRVLYGICPVAIIGGSFLPGLAGHNMAEAAAADCAVLTGPHVGHFSHMIASMKQVNPLSVLQVSGKLELEEALRKLFNDGEVMKAHRVAAKQAYITLSSGVVSNIGNLLEWHVLRHALC